MVYREPTVSDEVPVRGARGDDFIDRCEALRRQMPRRRFLGVAAAGLFAMISASCTTGEDDRQAVTRDNAQVNPAGATETLVGNGATPAAYGDGEQGNPTVTHDTRRGAVSPAPERGHLSAKPGGPNGEEGAIGLYPLGLDAGRDGWLYIPASYRSVQPMPLILALHGAGGTGEQSIGLLQGLADEFGVILVAPDSRRSTWDVIVHNYGPDVAFIDTALRETFSRYAIDPARVATSGFSDGASYALSLGITNGDLFTHILAFSPGFSAPADHVGKPLVYISHGTQDEVLPINVCSRRIVPRLEDAGYVVRYHEFGGPHTVPDEIAREAMEWFTA